MFTFQKVNQIASRFQNYNSLELPPTFISGHLVLELLPINIIHRYFKYYLILNIDLII